MNYPRILIAGVQSGVGKTTITLGILAALVKQGYKVQSFKVGPDYIDPALHKRASKRSSHNLDSWMGSPETIKQVFTKAAQDADISIIEGVMGLYDGAKNEKLKGSSADIAKILATPVVLVVNAQGMAASCVALVKGFMDYEPDISIKGIILNNAGSAYYKNELKSRLEAELDIKVLGCLGRENKVNMPERYLGLVPAEENKELSYAIDQMAELIIKELDMKALWDIAQEVEQIKYNIIPHYKKFKVKIAVARDEAFSFYYQDSLDFLEELGAELIFFSPIWDKIMPNADGLYLGGGFPELFMDKLSVNYSMMESIRHFHEKKKTIYAECGGYLYLCKEIKDQEGHLWDGVGLIPACAQMQKKLAALGYIEAKFKNDSILGKKENIVKGHEFHYSSLSGLSEDYPYAYAQKNKAGKAEGYTKDNLFTSFLHINLRYQPDVAISLLESMILNNKEKKV